MTIRQGASASGIKLYAFHCGGEVALRSLLDPFDPSSGEPVYLPYFFYLVRHPEGDVLYDSGPPLVATSTSSAGKASGSARGLRLSAGDDVLSQLSTAQVSGAEIACVIQSHLHTDHAGGLPLLPGAHVYVQERELEFASNPPVYQRADYLADNFAAVSWQVIDGDLDLFGDSSVIVFQTPGHTPGHQSMLLHLGGGSVILTGDAIYDWDKTRQRKLPGLLWSPDALVASWQRIESLQAEHSARVIVTHDTRWKETVAVAPGAWYS